MAKEREYILFNGRLYQLFSDDVIEVASPPRANSEQPLVGPPDKFEERPAALARPATLSEVVSFVEGMMQEYKTDRASGRFEQGVVAACERILQQLGTLGQGPVAQCPVEYTECELYMSRFK